MNRPGAFQTTALMLAQTLLVWEALKTILIHCWAWPLLVYSHPELEVLIGHLAYVRKITAGFWFTGEFPLFAAI
jgi:hypothetical protein